MAVNSRLNVVVTADDRTGSVFDRLTGNMDGLRNLALGVTGALAGAGAAVGAFGIKAIGAAADVEEMESKFNTVFGNLGGQVAQELDAFSAAAGRSKFEMRGMAAEFGDLLKPLGFTQEQAAGLSVDLSTLAADLSSFNNIPMDEALRRLQGTLVGAHENALKFGVVINENTLKAEMAANGWDELEGQAFELAKVQARLNLLTQGTTDAQGDAIKTADSFTNRMRALKARVADLTVEIGERLLPLAEPFITWLIDIADEWGPKIVEFLDRVDMSPFVQGIRDLLNADLIASWERFGEGVVRVMQLAGLEDETITKVIGFLVNMRDGFQHISLALGDIKDGDYDQAWMNLSLALEDFAEALGVPEELLLSIGVLLTGKVLAGFIGLLAPVVGLLAPVAALAGGLWLINKEMELLGTDFPTVVTTFGQWLTIMDELTKGPFKAFVEQWSALGDSLRWVEKLALSMASLAEHVFVVGASILGFSEGDMQVGLDAIQNFRDVTVPNNNSSSGSAQGGFGSGQRGNTYNIYTSQLVLPGGSEADVALQAGGGP